MKAVGKFDSDQLVVSVWAALKIETQEFVVALSTTHILDFLCRETNLESLEIVQRIHCKYLTSFRADKCGKGSITRIGGQLLAKVITTTPSVLKVTMKSLKGPHPRPSCCIMLDFSADSLAVQVLSISGGASWNYELE